MYAIKIQVFQTSELELFLNTSVQIAEYPHRGNGSITVKEGVIVL